VSLSYDHEQDVYLVPAECRVATSEEVTAYHRATPSESGYGWTEDGMYPFFPGMPCLSCGRFVGRDGYFGVEHFEMSNEIASVEAEHWDCARAKEDARLRRLVALDEQDAPS
jgi:hypothetical protein